jgi:predicted amidohydrolase YtcJ
MDTIFYNGTVKTMDGREARAVCVSGDRIAFVGTDADALALRSEKTELIDLGGRLTLPGFIDTHMHFLHYGQSLFMAQLAPAKSKAELLEIGREFIRKHPGLPRLLGAGWNNDHWSDDSTFPKREELDQISRDIPIAFTRTCYHIVCLNTKALEICGITADTPDLPGGRVGRNASGEPDGVLYEDACGLAGPAMQEPTLEESKEYLHAAAADAVRCGLTTVHADDLYFSADEDCVPLRVYGALLNEGWLPIRVYLQCRLSDPAAMERFFELGCAYGKGDPRLRFGPLKLIGDGSLGARTAYLKQPYCDAPDTRGIPIYTQEELDKLILSAALHGMPAVIHAIGDAAIEMALNAFEKARQIEPAHLRHGIIHCQITDRALLDRMKALDIMALVQPIFLDYDLHIADARTGGLAKTSYAFKTMLDLGIRMAFGSDAPVERFNAIQGIYHAVTRKDLSGFPEEGWYPDERLTVEEAVAGFTREAAYASCEEEIKGTISAGKLADLVVLDRDIFKIPADEIKGANVYMTVCGGKIVYRAAEE